MCSEFNVPCSVLWYRSFFAIGIIALGKQPDIVEDMSALRVWKDFEGFEVWEFEEFEEFEELAEVFRVQRSVFRVMV